MCRRMARGWDGLICFLGTTWLRVFLWNIVWRGADSANPYRCCRYYTLYFMGKTSRKHGCLLTFLFGDPMLPFFLLVKPAETMAASLLITYDTPR